MFSDDLYGRYVIHGYMLDNRAAISFNAIAEVMSDPVDEILFVDYNTPDDHPTFPEAIHDTLTDKCKKHMRVFGVRPEHHEPLKSKTHLVALEAQSRNLALRRSNPNNRWILYTNTDMLLVPRDERQSLSDVLGELPDGFYQTPRFELPEMLWEAAFDRRVAAANNKGRKTKMNDQDRYIWNVSTPYLREQAENWGWPDLEIEEVRLDRDTPYERYVAGLGKALEPTPNTIAQTSVDWHLFNDLTHDVPHTPPFVCDPGLPYPKNSALMVAG